MVRSMTGFGRAEQAVDDKTYLVEIKSLNGKQFDINLKMPALLKPLSHANSARSLKVLKF